MDKEKFTELTETVTKGNTINYWISQLTTYIEDLQNMQNKNVAVEFNTYRTLGGTAKVTMGTTSAGDYYACIVSAKIVAETIKIFEESIKELQAEFNSL